MSDALFQLLLALIWGGVILFGLATGSGNFPLPLTPEEEKHYINECIKGSKEAQNVLIERNLRLVAHVAKKYAMNNNIDLEELQSIGQFGLIKAVTTFNPERKIKLATYASKCIDNEILMYLRSGKKYGNDVYLQEPIGVDRDGNEVSLMDIMTVEGDGVEDQAELRIEIERLFNEMDNVLTKREKEILEMRYGLRGKKEYTQRDISSMMGISRSYVSRIEKKAIEKLRKKLY